MSKAKKTSKPAAKETTKPTTAATPAETNSKIITVAKKEEKLVGARAAWYAVLLAHDGQTIDVFVSACTKQPPSVPKSGKAEDPRGWLRYFVREGVATLS